VVATTPSDFVGLRYEIIWKRSTNTGSSKVLARGFSNDHDTIFLYSKSTQYVANKLFAPHSEEYVKSKFSQSDERGPYQLQPLKTVSDEKLRESVQKAVSLSLARGRANPSI